MFLQALEETGEVYQGHFGEFEVTKHDRIGVVVYRGALLVAALAFAVGAILILRWGPQASVLNSLTALFLGFCAAMGVSLATIHIYMVSLHRTLQVFWAIGTGAALWLCVRSAEPLAAAIYNHPVNLMAVGWIFVALTGLFFKEAFCFNRLETKFLTFIAPVLLLGHWLQLLPIAAERSLLGAWAVLFLIFALRKVVQPIPPDIGDKSVFTYLEEQKA
ncbi:hypothetical protein C1752_00998 [Acaryochloris thomasi RCC1774]|uniref:DUF2301 domain-containing membrane protein n=1 Tax=Acaryochloris thomasi RCC1774 TaxID=1764569 RepID=A0A2W1JZA4_9CYAN|nr:DUF2301 domain-containing membrane protein [Acaryochloris thomasi]PZD74764.1 hypothetical protein C1752_00998 [Acaryochloris thomasi RCC1774]